MSTLRRSLGCWLATLLDATGRQKNEARIPLSGGDGMPRREGLEELNRTAGLASFIHIKPPLLSHP